MGSVFQRGKSWVGEYKVNGKIKRKALGNRKNITKTMAREELRKKELEANSGQIDNPFLRVFATSYIKYVRDTLKRRSWYRYEYSLSTLLELYGNKKISEISPKDIDDFKEIRLRKVKPATVNRELSTLRQIYNLAKRWNSFSGENPVSISGLLPEENLKERILTFIEEDKLLSISNKHLKPIIITALNTGMRKSEILSLKWSNVDLENGVITIDQTNTKNKKTRRIPINSNLKSLLLEQKLKSIRSEYVFLSQTGKPYKFHDSIKNAFNGACRKAEIKGLRFHDLRHTAATRMIESGASIVAVSKILGHSDLKMTMRYSHPENSLIEAVELLSNKFSRPATDKSTDIAE
ncbi:MAG: integrase [Thermodesulfobacteriota bacterium]|nr:MAG: integrase [Thermodesulfobacteriota bacterium]